MEEKIIKQIDEILEEIKQIGIVDNHLNNAIDLLFKLRLEIEIEKIKKGN